MHKTCESTFEPSHTLQFAYSWHGTSIRSVSRKKAENGWKRAIQDQTQQHQQAIPISQLLPQIPMPTLSQHFMSPPAPFVTLYAPSPGASNAFSNCLALSAGQALLSVFSRPFQNSFVRWRLAGSAVTNPKTCSVPFTRTKVPTSACVTMASVASDSVAPSNNPGSLLARSCLMEWKSPSLGS